MAARLPSSPPRPAFVPIMWLFPRFIASLLICLLPGRSVIAADDVRELAHSIDQRIAERLSQENVTPAAVVSDHQFVRRVTLDLAGRVPTSAELDAFIASQQSDKRSRLVEQLIDSADFAFHQRNEIDTLLLRRLEHNDRWREYLLEATQQNRSWDQMFREIMLPEDTPSRDERPAAFLRKRINNIDATTNDSSIVWFGVNVGCAKCHDHPLVFDWTQAHYYGMASFFERTFQTKTGMLGERFDGRLKYTTTAGDELDADFMFLTGTKVPEPEIEIEEAKLNEIREAIKQSEKDDKAEPPPTPEFRPRAKFVDLALADSQQRFFAKNIVNRIWARLIGRGLVHPLDQMHSENRPSHPELLAALSDDLVSHGYDLKRLIQAIVLTDTYARNTQLAGEGPPDPSLFAAAIPRPLTPHQLSLSYRVATSSPDHLIGLVDAQADRQTWNPLRAELERQSEGYARQFDIPADGFQVSVSEALWFSNNPSVQNDLLSANGQKLVGYLKQLDSDAAVSMQACKSILSRPAGQDEQAMIVQYIVARPDRRQQAIAQVVWALLSSPEFRFNH